MEKDNDELQEMDNASTAHSNYQIPDINDESVKHQLSGMFQNWFLDYASCVILDRAVPHLYDGLKPVQRRILHAMKRIDDGRLCKAANIVGQTMQFHPHGDASIGSALVQLGQKNLLIDCQGNWGNILTGHPAAAARYIEARLSKFALEVLFNSKTTEWKMSYDGRNQEPVALPAKFPLLLAQGTEGIGVGLSTKILPHNFNELADASIAYLRGEEFALYPDFITGGSIDVSRYDDGRRDGKLKIRAKISKIDNKTICINEIPYGTTTSSVIESISKAIEKGKLQIKKVDDLTAANVEILLHLQPGKSPDKTIDALYTFTECQVSVAPNCCVIYNEKPQFLSVSDVLRFSADNTRRLLKEELLIEKAEVQESIFFCSLEKIFIEERIYKDKGYEESKSNEEAIAHIAKRMEPFVDKLIRPIEDDDLLKLLEIKMKRILRFNAQKADEDIAKLYERLKTIQDHLDHITDFTIAWFEHLKEKYGAAYPRRTEIRNFDNIEVSKVVEANEKLYINREEGFLGLSLKKDEFVCNCSDVDDIIVFYKDGKFKVSKVADKWYVGKNILYVGVFNKNDNRTIYNMVYRDGKAGTCYIKRFAINGLARDKEYDLTQGTAGTKVLYFTANANGEAEVLRVFLKPQPRLKKLVFDKDFSEVAIKGRASMGNILTKNEIQRISMKQKGSSTLGGRQVWFDDAVQRINYDGRGRLIGEFVGDDRLLVITQRGTYLLTTYDASIHFPEDLMRLEKYDPQKIWTAVLLDADQKNMPYIKRFPLEETNKELSFIGDNTASKLLLLTDTYYARIAFTEAEGNAPVEIDADDYIGIKSLKAKGKRLSTEKIENLTELEPLRFPEPEEEVNEEESSSENKAGQPDETGQYSLF